MSEEKKLDIPIEQVIEIHSDAKYLLIVPDDLEDEQLEYMDEALSEWWESDNPILIITDAIKLVRVDEVDVEEEEDESDTEVS